MDAQRYAVRRGGAAAAQAQSFQALYVLDEVLKGPVQANWRRAGDKVTVRDVQGAEVEDQVRGRILIGAVDDELRDQAEFDLALVLVSMRARIDAQRYDAPIFHC